ncbi:MULTISPECIES: hypothetical protein [Phyllobacteriaceae]|jgi:hypothetical protein|uniref:Uncharacterized protein n=1 Tax=Mesorhizobium hungaricum TaxID=1566387 RepID=A0A1C2DYF9_9HYPH|nr:MULTISPECIES: hypothetical protein [Mesorhizobium]MBN9234804.1 hypothetical protein [Mesorhizobium sp.]MDQ0328715.1 hypothetical protein [Mesorhizobium sp. YL-MeA3-2017]OCX19788.1 hypothetical protein QV13_09195 [Mesorhizobium hungaricum]
MFALDRTGSNTPNGPRGATAGFTDWLCLAATPTFAAMALLSAVTGGADMICSSMADALPLNGMVMMYLLMSAFHLPPWLRLVAGRAGRSVDADRPDRGFSV